MIIGMIRAHPISGDGLALRPSGIIGSIVGAVVLLAAADHYGHRRSEHHALAAGSGVLPAGLVNACRTDPFAW